MLALIGFYSTKTGFSQRAAVRINSVWSCISLRTLNNAELLNIGMMTTLLDAVSAIPFWIGSRGVLDIASPHSGRIAHVNAPRAGNIWRICTWV